MRHLLSFSFILMLITNLSAQLVLEQDINQEAASSDPFYFAELNGILYFSADDGIHGDELYQYQLSTGLASLAADVRPFESGSGISKVVAYDGKIYFPANNGMGSRKYMMVYDPADQSFDRLTDIEGERAWDASDPFVFNGDLFFAADFSAEGVELGKYNATTDQIELVADLDPLGDSNPAHFVEANGALWFLASTGQAYGNLYKYNPITDTVEYVVYQDPDSIFPNMGLLYPMDGRLYFRQTISGEGTELGAYDIATHSLIDIPEVYVGAGSSSPSLFTALNGKLYFAARTVSEGRELRVYDPLTNQTSLVADLYPSGNSNPGEMVVFNGKLYFGASVDETERRLFSYNPVGDVLTEEAALPNGDNPNYMNLATSVDSLIFLSCLINNTGIELYQFEVGAASGINLAADINETTIGSDPYGFTEYNGKLYFAAEELFSGREVWVYDPATGNASVVSDEEGSMRPDGFTVLEGKLFFSGTHPTNGYGLQYYDDSDGQIHSTSYLTPTQIGGITDLTALDGLLYFSDDFVDSVGKEIQVYDPALDSFWVAYDIYPGNENDSYAEDFIVFEGELYCTANDGIHGTELWRYNPTTGLATLAADINPGPDGSSPSWLAVYAGELYFAGFREGFSSELFSYHPTTGIVTQRTDFSNALTARYLTVYHDKLFFQGRYSSAVNAELLYYDAALDTTVLTEDLNPGASSPQDLLVFNDKLYFSVYKDGFGRELWEYNDTLLSIVTDIRPGEPDSDPSELTLFNGKMYFAANDGTHGTEIWSMAECLNLFVDTETPGTVGGTGAIDLTIQGGNPPYTILWSTGDTTEDVSGLEPGIYTVSVSDSSGCLSEISAEIGVFNAIDRLDAAQFSLFPNPTHGTFRIETEGIGIESVEVYDLQGRLVYHQQMRGYVSRHSIELDQKQAGLYLVRAFTEAGVAERKVVIR